MSWLTKKGRLTAVPTGRRTRRRLPHLLIGLMLIVACVGGALWWSSTAQGRVPVLGIARPVSIGHVLERADIHEVEISVADAVATVPAEQAASVLGRPMATSLTVGALLTPSSVGPPTVPIVGEAVVAVGLKAGQFPLELAPGAPVIVVVAASSPNTSAVAGQSSGDGPTWPATVTGLAKAESEQTTVISLRMPSVTAPALARIPAGQVTLVMVAGGER
ncbi:hypothetical protein [Amycolatopsis sp. NPDC021455]|uniref:hypothetical protein n=1 Tax=Amycolatopsis sp. NPDC021455 TaxID=3154901 RepID=UPI0033CBF611